MKDLIRWASPTFKAGDRFGKLVIIETVKIPNTYRYYALCQCDCGSNPKHIRIDGLTSGTISCGCAQKEACTTHGQWGSLVYKPYSNMMSRCYNPKDKRYSQYNGRGIDVCRRWHNILNFVNDMEPTFKKGLTIERIDNDKGYSPENCKWATHKEQNRNYRRNIKFTHNGKTLCLIEWSELLSIPYSLLWDRLCIQKWGFEKAISTPRIPTSESLPKALTKRWAKG